MNLLSMLGVVGCLLLAPHFARSAMIDYAGSSGDAVDQFHRLMFDGRKKTQPVLGKPAGRDEAQIKASISDIKHHGLNVQELEDDIRTSREFKEVFDAIARGEAVDKADVDKILKELNDPKIFEEIRKDMEEIWSVMQEAFGGGPSGQLTQDELRDVVDSYVKSMRTAIQNVSTELAHAKVK